MAECPDDKGIVVVLVLTGLGCFIGYELYIVYTSLVPPPPPPPLSDLAKLKISDWFKVGKILGFQEYDLVTI